MMLSAQRYKTYVFMSRCVVSECRTVLKRVFSNTALEEPHYSTGRARQQIYHAGTATLAHRRSLDLENLDAFAITEVSDCIQNLPVGKQRP